MTEIKWLQESGSVPEFVKDISDQMGETVLGGGCLLVGGPQWIRTPGALSPNLANRKMYIKQQGWVDTACPVCRAGAPIYVFDLEDDLMVSCCAVCEQYGWFMRPKEKKDVAVHGSGLRRDNDEEQGSSGSEEPPAI